MLRPLAVVGTADPAVRRIAEAPVSVVRGVPGSYVAERLAGVIDDWGRLGDCVWLRVSDAKVADLTQSVAAACRHRWSSGGGTGLRGTPPPRLDEELQEAPDGAVMVLELGGRVTVAVSRLVRAIRPDVTDRGVSVVVVAESRFHLPLGRDPDGVTPASALFDPRALEGLTSDSSRQRLVRYAGRRTAVLHDVLAAAQLWSGEPLAEAVDTSYGLVSFLDRLTAILVDRLTADQRSALEVASATGYWHPQMGTRPVAAQQLRPWLVPMERQWGWLRPIWAPSLRRELARPSPARQELGDDRAAAAETSHRGPAGRSRPMAGTPVGGMLEARLLGPFEVRIDGLPVSWNGQRGTSVLRYLLSRRQHACGRDELLEEFWPDVVTGPARNRLQVAVSGCAGPSSASRRSTSWSTPTPVTA